MSALNKIIAAGKFILSICSTAVLLFLPLPSYSNPTSCSRLVSNIPVSELGSSRAINQRLPFVLPDGWVEVEQELNEIDKMLWDLSVNQIEKGFIEVFSENGRRLIHSRVLHGMRGEIPYKIYFPELEVIVQPILKLPVKVGTTIRFTHTHPYQGFISHNGKIGYVVPDYLSPDDIEVAKNLRSWLDRVGLGEVSFEMTSVTYRKAIVRDFHIGSTFKDTLHNAFGRKWVKSTILSIPE